MRTRPATLTAAVVVAILSSCGGPTGLTCSLPSDCDDDDKCTLDNCVQGVCAWEILESCNLCGDGVVDDGEDCDDGGESASCNANCTTAACGDGVVNASAAEDCDVEADDEDCNADCTTAECGDGYLNTAAGEVCDDGNDVDTDACTNDCELGAQLTLTTDHVFDTNTGELDGVAQAGWEAAARTWHLGDLDVPTATSLTIVGDHALTLDVARTVVIAGVVDVSGEDGGLPTTTTTSCDTAGVGGKGGPGGFDGGTGAGNGGSETEDGLPGEAPDGSTPAGGGVASTVTDGLFGAGGGGGGGHAEMGDKGLGNSGGQGGTAGRAYASLPPLIGGGGGGGGSIEQDGVIGEGLEVADDEGSGGGGGGGAIAIVAGTSITVTGTIDATGGDGGSDDGCAENPGLGGGGAGGAIRLTSPDTDADEGTLDVSGGAGGFPSFNDVNASLHAGGAGGDGRVVIDGM